MRARLARHVAAMLLLASWGCSPHAPPPSATERSPLGFDPGSEAARLEDTARALRSRIERLRARESEPAARLRKKSPGHLPWTAPVAVPITERVSPPAAEPVLPLDPVALTLVGMAEQNLPAGTERTAILVAGVAAPLFATRGAALPGGFMLDRIDATSIDILHGITGARRCLALPGDSSACGLSASDGPAALKQE